MLLNTGTPKVRSLHTEIRNPVTDIPRQLDCCNAESRTNIRDTRDAPEWWGQRTAACPGTQDPEVAP
jgi:hypothetical protein